MTTESDRTLRETRRLTPEGKLIFEENVQKFSSKLVMENKYIDFVISDLKGYSMLDPTQAKNYQSELMTHLKQYQEVSSKFCEYLGTVRCEESVREKASRDIVAKSVFEKVSSAMMHLDSLIKTLTNPQHEKTVDVEKSQEKHIETYHTSTNSKEEKQTIIDVVPLPFQFKGQSETRYSRRSKSSRSSSILARQKAKVEAAKTRAKFAREEAELIRKQASIQADMKVLNVDRQVEEAECELKALSEAYGEDRASCVSEVNPVDIQQRTAEFILAHSDTRLVNNIETFEKHDQNVHDASHMCTSRNKVVDIRSNINTNLNANAPQFVPLQSNTQMTPSNVQQLDICKEFSQYVVKRDMLLSRLTQYDDTPGHYLAWKTTFKSVMSELNFTPSQELDLLVKWLGPESSEQALSIKSSNAVNPVVGVERVWTRLENRFGSPEMVESSLRTKLQKFGKINNKDPKKLYELVDIVSEIEAIKENEIYKTSFSVFDSSTGVNPIVSKLPYNIQEKWTSEASRYKLRNKMAYPPFQVFSEFLQRIAKLKNDPSFFYEETRETNTLRNVPFRPIGKSRSIQLSCARTETTGVSNNRSLGKDDKHESKIECPLHGTNHTLNACRMFRFKPITERKEFLKKKGLCFRCCGQKKHLRRDCKEQVHCTVCKSSGHPSAMHIESERVDNRNPQQPHEGEIDEKETTTYCTQICGKLSGIGKSCAKITLVKVYPKGQPRLAKTMYSLIDDQSNRSLATSNFFEIFQENGPETEYVLSSCAGKVTTSGRLARNYVLESLDGSCTYQLPTLIECNDIPNNRDEIASPTVALQYSHLTDIASLIPEIDNQAQIDLLIGRDLLGVHHVLDHRTSNDNLPYAQKLPLGWVIIGEVCLGKVHQPDHVSVNKTTILSNGRASLLKPCQSEISITNIFQTTEHDEKIGSSIEDDVFLKVMDSSFIKGDDNRWVAPLPFREDRPVLDNNRPLALKRARSLDYSLKSNSTKREHVLQFMKKMIENGHAEVAPPLPIGAECWYLPMFGVYHPRKPDSLRLVFDASAVYNDKSLNKVLLKGPDLTNSLLGILLRFRKEAIALTADVEQMFYNFKVCEEHRDYLRFIWHSDNDIDKPLQDFRMTVHVFGNGPSPSVATYGLRKSVETADDDVQNFVANDFYVDDGLFSCQDVNKAVSLIKRTQEALLNGGSLKLHKIASNSKEVLDQFGSMILQKI